MRRASSSSRVPAIARSPGAPTSASSSSRRCPSASARELARTLAEKAPVALRYAKEAVVKGLELPLADGLRLENDLATLLRTTEDRVEGAKAFLEKRKPRFTGK